MNVRSAAISRSLVPAPPAPPRPEGVGGPSSFQNVLMKSIEDVNAMQTQADHAIETLLTGGDADPAAVLTAVQKADTAFRLMMQMRNKVMQAYQEMRDIRI